MKRRFVISTAILLVALLGVAQNMQSLGDIARQIRSEKQSTETASPNKEEPKSLSTPLESDPAITPASSMLNPKLLDDDELAYVAKVQDLITQEKFAELDKLADVARSSKARLKGGNWQLYVFYDAVSNPIGDRVTVADWNALLERLKRWQKARPESVTPDIALAQANINLGWQSRGMGYADQVPENGWKGLHENLETAKQALQHAAGLKTSCPQQYAVAQQIALVEGWDKEKANALFEEAVSFEPSYYYYYRNQANYLQKHWYGEDGESQEFAARWASRLGGKQGLFVYFEIATVLSCNCDSEQELPKMSWKMIKDGYGAIEELYGSSLLKRNRFAYLAFRENDRPAARRAFLQMKTNWNSSVWGKQQTFESARQWAFADEQGK